MIRSQLRCKFPSKRRRDTLKAKYERMNRPIRPKRTQGPGARLTTFWRAYVEYTVNLLQRKLNPCDAGHSASLVGGDQKVLRCLNREKTFWPPLLWNSHADSTNPAYRNLKLHPPHECRHFKVSLHLFRLFSKQAPRGGTLLFRCRSQANAVAEIGSVVARQWLECRLL